MTANSKLISLGLTGLVSLVVGVASGVGVKYFTDMTPGLEFDITSAETFLGAQERIGIVGVRVTNPGRREVETVACRITVPEARIVEPRVSGLSSASVAIDHSADAVQFSLPYLNPSESFSVQLLVKPTGDRLEPAVEVRGKGVSGLQAERVRGDEDSFLLPLAVGIFVSVALSPALMRRFLKARRMIDLLPSSMAGMSQRDIFCEALSLEGMLTESMELRKREDTQTYWGLSTELTDNWLSTDDSEKQHRGIDVLKAVLEIAVDIYATSERIVQLNIARLALRVGDEDEAKQHLKRALEGPNIHSISLRLQRDKALKQLAESVQRPSISV